MIVYEWNDSLSTHNSRIDKDNRLILEKAQVLSRSIEFGSEDYEIIENLIDFKRVVREHFEQEEMMQQYDHFKNYIEHKNSHSNVLKQLNKLSNKIMKDPASINHVVELNSIISGLYVEHIQKYDTEAAKFFMNRDYYSN